MTTYPKVLISVGGVAKKLQLEANSQSKKPWYDDIVYLAYLNAKNEPVLYAGKCILFFELSWGCDDCTAATTTTAASDGSTDNTTKKPVFLALIHRYETVKIMQSLATNQRLQADNFNVEDGCTTCQAWASAIFTYEALKDRKR